MYNSFQSASSAYNELIQWIPLMNSATARAF